jgi:hypothetical protein
MHGVVAVGAFAAGDLVARRSERDRVAATQSGMAHHTGKALCASSAVAAMPTVAPTATLQPSPTMKPYQNLPNPNSHVM